MPVILENVTYRIKNVRNPLHSKTFNIESLRINDGEFVGIVNMAEGEGADFGKMLCGLIRPDTGSITVANSSGEMAASVYLASEAENAVSEQTVEKEVCSLLRKTEKNKEKLADAARRAVGLVGLDYETVKNKSPFELTCAERRAISLASLLALSPEIMVLDEPMKNMDAIWCKRLMELLKKLNMQGVTIILITADVSRISEYAGRVIIIKNGRIAIDSSAKNVFSEYFFLNHLGVDVPDVKKCCQMLRENGMDMPSNIILYEQFIDRLKILMWRKNK